MLVQSHPLVVACRVAGNGYVSVYKTPRTRDRLLEYYDRVLRNWPIPCEERCLESRSGTTHILLCGKEGARPLLLFHGTGNNCLMWRYNVAQLGEHFRLHLIDTINDPGKSEASREFDAETDYTSWTTEVLDALGVGKALLVGHSKGGWIVLNAVVNAPERVERIVLLAPAVGINSRLSPTFMRRSLRLGLFPTKRAVESYLRYMSGPGATISAEYASYLSKVIRGTKHRIIKHRQFSDDELGRIGCPVLLVFGDREVCVEYGKVVERARALIKGIDVQIVPGTGHALQGEKPETVNKLIIDHLTA
ncbi:MAG: alpha/beta hydrolase [Candidatus Eisenbacteria bacterium]|nr:alpha/beta hydrolase [Candidatus Eisenbacteria bacterium]